MALKKLKDGTYKIESEKDLQEAASAIEQRESDLTEIEQMMEDDHDYLTMRDEIGKLDEAIRTFMSANDVKHVYRDDYAITLIRRMRSRWDADKLKKLVPKGMFLKLVTVAIDPQKIDNLVREGKLDSKKIASALVETPEKPHTRRFPYKEGQSRDDAMAEEAALRAQLSQSAVKASGSKRK